ncbi:MAG: DUF1439 domain-containing protein [Pseudomonadota bacterium]
MKNAAMWRQPARAGAFALLTAMLASCASLVGPRQLDVPLSRLQQGLDQRFPLHERVLDMFQVQLAHPQLSIPAGGDRVAVSMDASVAPPFMRQAWRGNLALSGRLEVDASRNAVFIRDARVDRFTVDGLNLAAQPHLANIANLITGQFTRDMPLYRFRPEDLRYAGMQFAPIAIVTQPSGLVVTFAPAR